MPFPARALVDADLRQVVLDAVVLGQAVVGADVQLVGLARRDALLDPLAQLVHGLLLGDGVAVAAGGRVAQLVRQGVDEVRVALERVRADGDDAVLVLAHHALGQVADLDLQALRLGRLDQLGALGVLADALERVLEPRVVGLDATRRGRLATAARATGLAALAAAAHRARALGATAAATARAAALEELGELLEQLLELLDDPLELRGQVATGRTARRARAASLTRARGTRRIASVARVSGVASITSVAGIARVPGVTSIAGVRLLGLGGLGLGLGRLGVLLHGRLRGGALG